MQKGPHAAEVFALMQDLMFNNLVCTSHGNNSNSSSGLSSPAQQQPQYTAKINGTINTTSIFLEYTPIDYFNVPVNTPPFSQFLVRWSPHLCDTIDKSLPTHAEVWVSVRNVNFPYNTPFESFRSDVSACTFLWSTNRRWSITCMLAHRW